MMLGKTPPPPDLNQSDVRQQLQTELLNAVKNCQTRFGGRTELATELDPHIKILCTCFEYVLSHGLRSKQQIKKNSAIRQVTDKVLGVNGVEHVVFWHFVREHLTKHEKERYEVLRQVWTDIGRGRAWLRSALNERSLERYLLCLLDSSSDLLKEFYEDWAFLRDQERSSILPTAAAGLGSILFAISIDKPELNHGGGVVNSVPVIHLSSPSEPVIPPPPVAVPCSKRTDGRRRKKIPPNIISFDDDESDTTHSHSDISMNTPPSPNPLPTINQSNAIDGAGIAVTVGVECLEPELSNTDLEAIISDSEHELPSSLPSSVSLRPMTNGSVGELIPVPLTEETHSSEDSLSVPSFSEDVDCSGIVEVGTAVEVREDNGNVNDNCFKSTEEEVIKLRHALISERETTVALRAQLTESCKQHEDKIHSTETRIQALNRENELLKHQLRKYVMAVQMLKQDSQGDEEARLYEQKLVQVAEMHGELMELNDRLQRSLFNKEGMIRRLREELEALRGPLPIDSDDDDLGPTLVSLWIPSVFLSGQSPHTHHVYQVHIRICDDEWNIYRRYTQFYNLHKQLKKQYSVITTFQFPPKKTIGNKDARFVEERRHRLQQYLRRVMNYMILNNSQLATAPSKPLLISLLPFFGENSPAVPEERHRSNSKNLFSRRSVPDSPQYTGL
ncbi:sorting nexin-29 isoform X2 [Lycorma delicatula]